MLPFVKIPSVWKFTDNFTAAWASWAAYRQHRNESVFAGELAANLLNLVDDVTDKLASSLVAEGELVAAVQAVVGVFAKAFGLDQDDQLEV